MVSEKNINSTDNDRCLTQTLQIMKINLNEVYSISWTASMSIQSKLSFLLTSIALNLFPQLFYICFLPLTTRSVISTFSYPIY